MLTMAPASVWKSLENWVYPGAWEYTEAERKMGNFVVLTDYVAIPIFVAIYLTLHSGLSVAGTGSEEAALPVHWAPAIFSAAVFCFVFYQHMYVMLFPIRRDESMWLVQQKVGRWVFLTRHVVMLQTIHAVASLFFPAITNTMCVFMAGLGLFVTVQYYSLVHWEPENMNECRFYAKKNVPYRQQMAWVHIPAGTLGLLDVFVTRPREAVLAALPTPEALAAVLLGYVAFYTLLIHVNHHFTGEYPYGILRPLGTFYKNPSAWLKFIAVQVSVIGTFLVATFLGVVGTPMFIA